MEAAIQPHFEIGASYRHLVTNRIFLAMSSTLLVTAWHGKIRPPFTANREEYRSIRPRPPSVEELCEIWGISLEQLDLMTERYFPKLTVFAPRCDARLSSTPGKGAAWREFCASKEAQAQEYFKLRVARIHGLSQQR